MGSCIQTTSYIYNILSYRWTVKNEGITIRSRAQKWKYKKVLNSDPGLPMPLSSIFLAATVVENLLDEFRRRESDWFACSWDVHLLPPIGSTSELFTRTSFGRSGSWLHSSIAVPALLTCGGKLVLSRTQGASCEEARWWVFKCKILLEILFIARHLVSDDWQFCDQVEPAQVQSPGKSNLASKHCQPFNESFISTL